MRNGAPKGTIVELSSESTYQRCRGWSSLLDRSSSLSLAPKGAIRQELTGPLWCLILGQILQASGANWAD